MEADRTVRAAGGVVVRPDDENPSAVLLVHRPRYDDWTFPKGKAEPGESDEDCALREVEEETTLRCTLGRELPATSYVDGKGRPKRVRWWIMRPVDGEPAPAHEVDEVRWVDPDEAESLLTYDRDRNLLAAVR
jgi:8-oxo-dGTP diphosphatase